MKKVSLQLATAIAALVLGTFPVSGKVLIYKGTLRAVSDKNSSFPKRLQVFQVFDPDLSVSGTVTLFEKDGQKLILKADAQDIRFAQVAVAGAKTATVISLVSANGGSNDFFENFGLHYRGLNKPIRFSSELVSNITSFPRLLLGTAFDDESFNGESAFVEQRVLLTYQEERTVAANDANLTAQQVLDGLVTELQAKGFQLP